MNALTLSGDTSIGVNGRKYRWLEIGEKNATPSPPLVIASRTPCDVVATKMKSQNRRRLSLTNDMPRNRATRNVAVASAKKSE